MAKKKLRKSGRRFLAKVRMGSAAAVGVPRKNSASLVAAMAKAPTPEGLDRRGLRSMLTILKDEKEPEAVRLGALRSLQAASFSVVAFESLSGAYVDALHKIATDPDEKIREEALGLLARQKDSFAQTILLDGLKDPKKALVPTATALQLLSYDPHTDVYPLARKIAEAPPSPLAHREALRLLTADKASVPLFEKVLQDKKQKTEIRQVAAAALQASRPTALLKHARTLSLDKSEPEEMRALGFSALTQFGNKTELSKDAELRRSTTSILKAAGKSLTGAVSRYVATLKSA